MDPWSQTRHCDVSFDPWCQVKGEENRKLTCDLTLATFWLLLPVWSGGSDLCKCMSGSLLIVQVHLLPPQMAVCWIQQHDL